MVFEGSDLLFCLLSGSTFLSLDLVFRFSGLFPSCSAVGAEMHIFLSIRGLLILSHSPSSLSAQGTETLLVVHIQDVSHQQLDCWEPIEGFCYPMCVCVQL